MDDLAQLENDLHMLVIDGASTVIDSWDILAHDTEILRRRYNDFSQPTINNLSPVIDIRERFRAAAALHLGARIALKDHMPWTNGEAADVNVTLHHNLDRVKQVGYLALQFFEAACEATHENPNTFEGLLPRVAALKTRANRTFPSVDTIVTVIEEIYVDTEKKIMLPSVRQALIDVLSV